MSVIHFFFLSHSSIDLCFTLSNATFTNLHGYLKKFESKIHEGHTCTDHPIRVVEQGNYHVNVLTKCSGVQQPMISILFIPQ